MNYSEILKLGRQIFNEDAGSEGSAYIVTYKGELKEEGFKVEDKKDGEAKILFDYPRDYGFAMETLRTLGVEVIKLELLY